MGERVSSGWWTGELSSSALSTATAVTALTLVAGAKASTACGVNDVVMRGYEWLVQNQNADGGWGDTTRSFSNLSTSLLVWAAFGVARNTPPRWADCITAAERYLTQTAGSLSPQELVRAIEANYGADRTFSIPILTMCALCGRLGSGSEGWRYVRQLPFEVAALPQRWFGALKLPVVSYALPALIAIGQVRHAIRPTRNPLLQAVRNRCRRRTLDKLVKLQPENGGFLEATPLTSFVTMSLAAMGLADHVVAQRGVSFIEMSARPDGSWPIDTNLATWVTTLSVDALGDYCAGNSAANRERIKEAGNPAEELTALRGWLLGQQGRIEHPYTLAAAGGWAWTDLPGGVPDADDTAGALLALHRLDSGTARVREAAEAGVNWLLGLQNRDGGIPTFCRGWGKLPFDRSSPDITTHAIRAWNVWRAHLAATTQRRVDVAIARATTFLRKEQRADGAWIPLWFGHQENAASENPLYGTARVVIALCECAPAASDLSAISSIQRAVDWLIAHQNADGGWSGAPGTASSMEESGLAIQALAAAWAHQRVDPLVQAELRAAIASGANWLVNAVENEAWQTPTPIGLYFAKLWYFERLYPLIFANGALRALSGLQSQRRE
jgi:squalene-hopene/tetraprenyl-beta-curcumene cyclase